MVRLTTGKDAWVDRLSEQDLPVMASVLAKLKLVVEDKEASALQLAEVILTDGSLTARVLKVANSAYYLPASTAPISTLSRAVVQLGIEAIKGICISVLVLENFLQGGARDRLLHLLASSFHTATQAKNLFERSGDASSDGEEVLIAGLLFNLGDMAFWSFGNEQADQLDQMLKDGELSDVDCEKNVLGLTLKTLTRELTDRWGLGNVLKEALKPGRSKQQAAVSLQIGTQLVQAIECGWHSEEFNQALDTIVKHYDIDRDEARELAMQGAEEAAAVVLSHGANQLCHLIPSPSDSRPVDESMIMTGNPELQLNILRELGIMAQEKVDLNTLFQAVLEGLHRGVGFERAVIALLNKDHTVLTAKYAISNGTSEWKEKFAVSLDNPKSPFNLCIKHKKMVTLEIGSKLQLLAKDRRLLENEGTAIIAPILIKQRLLGVYYVDRGGRELPLDQSRKEGFQHFSQQANMCLALMVAK